MYIKVEGNFASNVEIHQAFMNHDRDLKLF